MNTTAQALYRKRIGYQGVLLGLFTTVTTALLVMGNVATYDTIEQRKAEDLLASLGQVIPHTIHDNNLLADQLTINHEGKDTVIYRGIQGTKVTAVAFGVSESGYSGEISLILGVNRNGELLGVRVISHTETPGLGDKIESRKTHWIFGFDGRSFDNLPKDKWAVKKDGGVFDQFSGATITPRAVVRAVKNGLMFFNEYRSTMLADKTGSQPAGINIPAATTTTEH